MNKSDLIIFIILILMTASANANHLNTGEWRVNRLLSPTFSEVQSEAVYSTITDYGCIDDKMIEMALDKHFERMEYMSFGNCKQELK